MSLFLDIKVPSARKQFRREVCLLQSRSMFNEMFAGVYQNTCSQHNNLSKSQWSLSLICAIVTRQLPSYGPTCMQGDFQRKGSHVHTRPLCPLHPQTHLAPTCSPSKHSPHCVHLAYKKIHNKIMQQPPFHQLGTSYEPPNIQCYVTDRKMLNVTSLSDPILRTVKKFKLLL